MNYNQTMMKSKIMQTKTHALPNARTLAYCEYGDPEGHPVLYAHGGPGSRLEDIIFPADHQPLIFKTAAEELGRNP